MPSDALKAWAEVAAHLVTAATLLVAITTLFVGWRNYALQGVQKRVEFFFEMWDQLRSKTTERLDICEVIDARQWDKLGAIPVRDRRQKLFLFEQVAMLVNSGLMAPAVAHYMFGYHAIKCWDRPEFWPDLPDRDSDYWKLLRGFVQQMRKVDTVPWPARRRKMKF
jgi:hypothetical protein